MKKIVLMGTLGLLSVAGVAFAGENWDPNCGCMRNSPSTVNTVAQAVSGSKSTSESGAVGIGTGGPSTAKASTGNVLNDIKTGNVKSRSSSTASGNGAIVSYDSFIPVQVPVLPPTIVASGGITLAKSGPCGPRLRIKPFTRKKYVPEFFGLYEKSVTVKSLQGQFEGLAKRPFIYSSVVLPKEYGGEKINTAFGDQLYTTVGNDGQGGGSGSAANYASRTAVGLGAALSANSSYGIVAQAALTCVFAEKKAYPKPSVIGLNTPKVDVLATSGQYRLFKIPKGPFLCGGKQIPHGYYCRFERNHVKVVKNVTMTK